MNHRRYNGSLTGASLVEQTQMNDEAFSVEETANGILLGIDHPPGATKVCKVIQPSPEHAARRSAGRGKDLAQQQRYLINY